MLKLANCKINLGLQVLRRRPDGYHDVATAMFPVPWCDVVEVVPSQSGSDELSISGNPVDCPPQKNLVMKALRAMREAGCHVPPTHIYLHKIVPDGAGLGGGSSDAAATVMAANDEYSLGLSTAQMADILAGVGSDCPFFVYGRPMMATGTGTVLSPIDINLEGYHILVVKIPGCSVSTAQAYAGVHPSDAVPPLEDILTLPVDQWQGRLLNDFEPSVFEVLPQVAQLKQRLQDAGAVYTAMSGSGSAVFALMPQALPNDQLSALFPATHTFQSPLSI